MRKFRIDYYAGAWGIVYLKREYKEFNNRAEAAKYAAMQGYANYEIMTVA